MTSSDSVGGYTGYKEVSVLDEDAAALFNGNAKGAYGCLRNQYLLLTDGEGAQKDIFKSDGAKLRKITYRTIKSKFLGKIEPRNPQQYMATDMLYDADTTVKVITGVFGSGEILCPYMQ